MFYDDFSLTVILLLVFAAVTFTAHRQISLEMKIEMRKSWKLVFLVCLMSHGAFAIVRLQMDYVAGTEDMKKLPRFWTNTGFSPPEPVEHVDGYFESDDVKMNLEIIGSLPNGGIRNVRVHWLLNLVSIR